MNRFKYISNCSVRPHPFGRQKRMRNSRSFQSPLSSALRLPTSARNNKKKNHKKNSTTRPHSYNRTLLTPNRPSSCSLFWSGSWTCHNSVLVDTSNRLCCQRWARVSCTPCPFNTHTHTYLRSVIKFPEAPGLIDVLCRSRKIYHRRREFRTKTGCGRVGILATGIGPS